MMRNATPRINNGTLAASLTTTITTPIIISNLGRAAPAHGIPSRLLRRITCAPKLGSRALVAECLWRRLEPLARSRRRRLRTRWRGVHFRSPDRSGVLLAVRGAPCSVLGRDRDPAPSVRSISRGCEGAEASVQTDQRVEDLGGGSILGHFCRTELKRIPHRPLRRMPQDQSGRRSSEGPHWQLLLGLHLAFRCIWRANGRALTQPSTSRLGS